MNSSQICIASLRTANTALYMTELVRDRIIVGVCNYELSKKFQLVADLMLEDVVTQARQSELLKTQQTVVREGINIDQISGQSGRVNRRARQSKKPQSRKQQLW